MTPDHDISERAGRGLEDAPVPLFHRMSGLMRVLAVFGASLLFGTMVVTCVDVVGRYFLNKPLPGGFELTEIMMAALIFLGMPLVTLSGEHIKVDLLDLFVSARVRWIQDGFAHLIGCGVSALLAWTLWVKAGQVAAYQDHTETLGIPLAPIAYLMVAMMTVTALIFAVQFGRLVMKRRA